MLCISWMRSAPTRRSSPEICAQVLDHQRRVLGLHVHARAHGTAANPEIAQVVGAFLHASQATVERPGVGSELLTQADRHRILEVRATRLHDVVELLALSPAKASRSDSNARTKPSSCDRHANRMQVGIVSFVLCAMFT